MKGSAYTMDRHDEISSLVQKEIQLRRYGNMSLERNPKQKEIEDAWEDDKRTLDAMTSALNKTNDLTAKMMDTLNTFDGRVSKLLDSIGLVQQQTNKWKQVHTNINKALTHIEDILAKFERIDTARVVIKQKLSLDSIPEYRRLKRERQKKKQATTTNGSIDEPKSEVTDDEESETSDIGGKGIAELDDYLQTFDSVLELEKYFRENSSFKSSQSACAELALISQMGHDRIFSFFDTLLLYHEKPLKLGQKDSSKPYRIKRGKENLLKGQNLEDLIMDTRGILQLLPEYAIRHLSKLIKRLHVARDRQGERSYLQVYIDRRAQFLVKTLRNAFNEGTLLLNDVKDDKTGQKSLVGGVITALGMGDKLEQKRKEQEFLAASSNYVKGSHPFLMHIKIQLLLLRSERELAEALLPEKVALHSFIKIASPVLTHFTEMSDALIRALRRNPNRIYGSSVLLDIFSAFKPLLPLYEYIFNSCPTGEETASMTNFWVTSTSAARQTFQQVLEDVRNDSVRIGLPQDGTVHELTSMTINFLNNLFLYKESVLELLPPQPSLSKVSTLGDYIMNVISALKANLDEKARRDKRSSSLSNIFLLNNYHFIFKSVSNSQLANEVGPHAIAMYQDWVNEQLKIYRSSWDKLLDYLIEDRFKQSTRDKLASLLHSKETAIIKARFNGFNSEFEDTYKTQVRYLIPDQELRNAVRRDLRQRIVPPYRAFVEKYKDVQFTKKPQNRAKYEKYDAATVESMLNQLFSGQLD